MTSALIIDGHPDPHSLTSALATRYAEGYGDASVLHLRDLDFDVHLRHGYRAHMPLEADLERAKHAMHDARRIVVATPLWWGSVPALLGGFFSRALLPHEEYRYRANGLPEGLLAGRAGRILLLADTPRLWMPIVGVPAVSAVRRNTLGLCGVRPAPVTRFAGVKDASPQRIQAWLERAAHLGDTDARRDAARPAPVRRVYRFADSPA